MVNINTFSKNQECPIIACDTETYTYIDGEKVTTEELQALFSERDADGNILRGVSWAREHVSVRAWAWVCSDGEKLAILPDFGAWCEFCCQHRVKTVWWYNAKFDFSYIDYEILSNGWRVGGRKLSDCEFSSLHGEQGQRYKLSLCRSIARKGRNAPDRHARPWTWNNYDFMNIFGGGLAANLKSFNVCDYHGNPIRKLEMDYQAGEDDERAAEYIANDAHGLFHLVRIASEFLEAKTGYSLMGEQVQIMTAGGLAKRVLLRTMYGKSDRENVEMFKRLHPLDAETDKFLRYNKLYSGGKTIVNPYMCNKPFTGKIFYYDRNSMYPAEMSIMPDLVGNLLKIPKQYEAFYREHEYQIIYEISDYVFDVGDGCLPIFYDPFTKKYVESFMHSDYNNRPFMMFDFEIENISKFYTTTFKYKIVDVYAIKKKENKAIAEYVNFWYNLKAEAKLKKDGVLSAFAKLLLNSSYGKLAQNCERQKSHREISEITGAVHLVEDENEIDEKSILSVIMGAYITAKARCALCNFMIEICGSPENTLEHIFYCDTDSVQTDIEYKKADPITLGGWKLENGKPFTAGKWLAPKTYFLYEPESGYTVHSKGVQTKTMSALLEKELPLDLAFEWFSPNKEYHTLAGLNVRGGKALLPLLKQLCRTDNIHAIDESNLYDERC